MTCDWPDRLFEKMKHEYPELRFIDAHETCQGCFYKYNHVLQRALKVELSKRGFISSGDNWTEGDDNPYALAQPSKEMQNDDVNDEESAWKDVLLLPFPSNSHNHRPFPALQYLAKLAIWENMRKNIAATGVDPAFEMLKLPAPLQSEVEKFVIQEEMSMRKHLCLKFREVLFCTDFLKDKVFH